MEDLKVIERPVSTRVPNIILMKVDPPLPAIEGATTFYKQNKNDTVTMYKDLKLKNGDIMRIEQEKPVGPGYTGDCSNGENTTIFWENEGWVRKDVADADDQKAKAETLRLAEIEKREAALAKREAELAGASSGKVSKGDK